MTPSRPYLLRAFYEWLVDNDLTPHLVVHADMPDVTVPQQYVQNGQIVLNVAPGAIAGLVMGNEVVSFSARFGGVPFQVSLPIAAIQAIYARENGAGTVFEEEPGLLEDEGNEAAASSTQAPATSGGSEAASGEPGQKLVDPDASDDAEPKPPKKGKPTLRVIK